MIRSISALIALLLAGGALAPAQEPRLVVPKLRGVYSDDANRPDPSKDVARLYASLREAALAAFQAGYKSATATEKRLERAMGLFLLSLRRDPTLAKALYNLGILCAQSSRWSDAISFQSEFQMQPGVEPAWLKSSASEVERLKTIMQLDGTPEGKRRMQFDRDLGLVLKMTDPIPALNAANRLAQRDKNFWEAPALAGIFHAETKTYSESAKFLDQAAGLAPSDRRANLELAADAARKEAAFADQVREAGISWEKQQYEKAAKAYQAAWKGIPTRLETGMQAATGFLMADQVAPAVEILSSMRESAPPEMAAKISAMLHELGAISGDANAAAGRIPPASQPAPAVELAARIRKLIGPLDSLGSEVERVGRAAAPLLSDTSYVTPIPDDEVTGPRSDMAFLSTASIFAMYQRDLARSATGGAGAGLQAPAAPAVQPATPAVQPATPATQPPAAGVPPLALEAPAPLSRIPAPASAPAAVSPEVSAKEREQNASANGKTYEVMLQSKTRGVPIYVNDKPSGKVTPARLTLVDGDTLGVEINGVMNRVIFEAKNGSFLMLPW